MGKNINRIGAFLLYTGCMRQKEREGDVPLCRYVYIAEKKWENLNEDQKRIWKVKAAELRHSDVGIEYLIIEKRLKQLKEIKYLEQRDYLFNQLLKKCENVDLFY
jgi:hypothetical protein